MGRGAQRPAWGAEAAGLGTLKVALPAGSRARGGGASVWPKENGGYRERGSGISAPAPGNSRIPPRSRSRRHGAEVASRPPRAGGRIKTLLLIGENDYGKRVPRPALKRKRRSGRGREGLAERSRGEDVGMVRSLELCSTSPFRENVDSRWTRPKDLSLRGQPSSPFSACSWPSAWPRRL